MVELGQTAQDSITGFEGRVTGRAEYITGCAQVLLQPKKKADGDFVEGRWFDETRVSITDAEPLTINTTGEKPGADKPAPIK